MAKTSKSAGSTARLISPYLNSTDKCLELYFWIRAAAAGGDDADGARRNVTRLSVVAVSEESEERTLLSHRGPTADFMRLFTHLPPGAHRLVIEGRRDSTPIDCAISIDDIAVTDCSRFGMSMALVCTRFCLFDWPHGSRPSTRFNLLIGFMFVVLFLSVLVIPMCGRLSWPALWSTFWRTIIYWLVDWLIDWLRWQWRYSIYSTKCRHVGGILRWQRR